jgi:hypothetical protein
VRNYCCQASEDKQFVNGAKHRGRPVSGGVSTLINAVVRYPSGIAAGRIDELWIEPATGRISYLILRSEDGRTKKLRWSALEIVGGKFLVRAERLRLVE